MPQIQNPDGSSSSSSSGRRKPGEPVQIHDQSVTSKSKLYAALTVCLVVVIIIAVIAIAASA